MTDQPEAHPAGVYWPGGDQIDARPSAYWHHGKSGDWAIVKLSSNVTVHVHTRAQARAILAAFAKAVALLPAEDGEDDGEPEPACVRCRSAEGPLVRLVHEPGFVCENSGACGRRKAASYDSVTKAFDDLAAVEKRHDAVRGLAGQLASDKPEVSA